MDQAAVESHRLEAMATRTNALRRVTPARRRTALGGSAIAQRSRSPSPQPSSVISALLPWPTNTPLNPANRRMRTRMYGGVGGEQPRGYPLSRFMQQKGPH